MTFEEDLAAEGEPEQEFHPGIAARLPRKRVAGGALIRNDEGHILFVTPTYKPTLEIPGGIANPNESPRDACRREITEELSLNLDVGPLLVVDWIPEHGVWGDGIMFIFDGGILTPDQIATITLADDELSSYAFLPLEQALPKLKPSLARRLHAATEAANTGHPRYLEFGR